jgi:hypothetical protein
LKGRVGHVEKGARRLGRHGGGGCQSPNLNAIQIFMVSISIPHLPVHNRETDLHIGEL